MAVVIDGTTGISTPANTVLGNLSYTGTLTGNGGIVNLGSGQVYKDASGNVGIGTSSPDEKLHIKSNVAGVYLKMQDSTGTAFVGCNAGALQFFTGSTERARIDSSGNLLVGKAAQSATTRGFQVVGSTGTVNSCLTGSTNAESTYEVFSTGASNYRFYIGMGGTVYATSTTITGISDARLKENIRDLDDGLDVVMALKPRKFDWKEGKGASIKNARGFIAQEFEQVLPDMIEEWKDPAPEGEEPYKAVNANLIPTLVKAIQEQQTLITALTARITALEAK